VSSICPPSARSIRTARSAIVDTEGPGGKEARVFDSTAVLLYLADKTGKFLGAPEDRPNLLSWLLFIASGLGPLLAQFAAPEGLGYAVNRYCREAERHYQVLNDHLAGREFIVRSGYTIADLTVPDRDSRGLVTWCSRHGNSATFATLSRGPNVRSEPPDVRERLSSIQGFKSVYTPVARSS
jgi:glutathione S-transferase